MLRTLNYSPNLDSTIWREDDQLEFSGSRCCEEIGMAYPMPIQGSRRAVSRSAVRRGPTPIPAARQVFMSREAEDRIRESRRGLGMINHAKYPPARRSTARNGRYPTATSQKQKA